MARLCNFHSHIGSELNDSAFTAVIQDALLADADAFINESTNVEIFLKFAREACESFKTDWKKHQVRGGFLLMDVFVQVIYLYMISGASQANKCDEELKTVITMEDAIGIIIEMIEKIDSAALVKEIKVNIGKFDKLKNEEKRLEISCRRFIKKSVKATKTKLFDDAYFARGIYYGLKINGVGGEEYGQALKNKTLDELKGVGHYMELSLNASKYTKGELPYLPKKNYDINKKNNIFLLHMTNAHHKALSSDDAIAEQLLYSVVKESKDLLSKESNSNVIGIDWLAPEGYEFERERTIRVVGRFLDLLNGIYLELQEEGNGPKYKKIVFRPHVGEGCSVFNGDQSKIPLLLYPREFMVNAWGAVNMFVDMENQNQSQNQNQNQNQSQNQTPKPSSGLERYVIGEFARYMGGDDFSIGGKKYDELKRRAINNARVMTEAIADWCERNTSDNLLFRLGHVTHCDKDTAKLIKDKGIYVDLNLGSNIRTGALNGAPGFGAIDYARTQVKDKKANDAYNSVEVIEEIKNLWGVDVYKESGFYQLVKAGCKILIGDDGVGVEVTGIKDEYKRVKAVFDGFDEKVRKAYTGDSSDFYTKLETDQNAWIQEVHGVSYDNTYKSLRTFP
ncbi:hypothetical protein L7P61_04355 [Aeromonas veronii bv. sobria]|uniref:hypothetical protein n=1 Tax=Aeromonas veronii TaxID=654 RepID=UPI0015F128E0|nr:hypothetical protein [Aeromonas veronii]